MKENLSDTIKGIYANGKRWIQLEIEYAKLTATEKLTVLLTTLIFGLIGLLLGMVVLILLGFAAAAAFSLILAPWLAFLCAAGAIIVLIVVLILLRKPLVENPISRLISKLILDLKPEEDEQSQH